MPVYYYYYHYYYYYYYYYRDYHMGAGRQGGEE